MSIIQSFNSTTQFFFFNGQRGKMCKVGQNQTQQRLILSNRETGVQFDISIFQAKILNPTFDNNSQQARRAQPLCHYRASQRKEKEEA